MYNKNDIPLLAEEIHVRQLGNDYLVENKALKTNFRISKQTYYLLSLIDGYRSVDDLKSLLESKYNQIVTSSELTELVFKNLGSKGFIANSNCKIKLKKRQYLRLTLTLVKASMVDKIAKFLTPLFEPLVIYTLVLLSLILSSYLLFSNWNIINSNWSSYLTVSNLTKFMPIFIINIMWHEFGHATACKYYGASVGRIGFGFYFISPVLFADVSGAWSLSKYKRLTVDIGGVYFELMVVSLLSLYFLFTNDIIILYLIFFVMTQTFLLNLNPFLRADGYWILSDLVEIPNLRSKSVEVVKSIIKRRNNINRTNVFLVIYGVSNFIVLLLFLGYTLTSNSPLTC